MDESDDEECYRDDGTNERSESSDKHTEGVSEDDTPAASAVPVLDAVATVQDAVVGVVEGMEEDVAQPSMMEGALQGAL